MGLDATGHYVPASTDAPARSAFDKLSRSLRDPLPVANTAARTALLATLAAASPAVVPSTSSPIFFYQQDLPAGYRTVYTVDGSNFISLSGVFVWANAAGRTAATTMVAGDFGYQVDTKIKYRYSGTAWKEWESDWITDTMTTSATLGTGSASELKHKYIAGEVRVKGYLKRGSTGGWGSNMAMNLPVTAEAVLSPYFEYNGRANLYDSSVPANYALFVHASASSATVASFATLSSVVGGHTGFGDSVPVVAGTNDVISFDFFVTPA